LNKYHFIQNYALDIYVKCIIVILFLDNIFLCVKRDVSIPEGVSVATVIIDGVDVAPAGVVKRSSYSREPRSCPAGIRTRALKGS
jgi:hypothetical protein